MQKNEISQEFLTIQSKVEARLTVKRSRFIASAAPVEHPEMAKNFIQEISSQYADATHNCFAYKLGVGDQAIFKISDAGEPSGTAGRPILQAIESKNLTNIAVVVTRYFGGIKLGIGGLIQAYSAAAMAVLNRAKIVKYYPKTLLKLIYPYTCTNAVNTAINRFKAAIINSCYDETVQMEIEIKRQDRESIIETLNDLSGGKVRVLY
ncbi:MAG: YigZ family protein [Calditrichaeota bacterium]|nr:MAG: YigZ family protein [Calditrichota bacterium]